MDVSISIQKDVVRVVQDIVNTPAHPLRLGLNTVVQARLPTAFSGAGTLSVSVLGWLEVPENQQTSSLFKE